MKLNNTMIFMLLEGLGETLYMTVASSLFAYIFGLPLGILLVVTDRDGILSTPRLNQILGFAINVLRSVPFLILLIVVIPVTRFLVGTVIGSTAAIVPLVIASAPYVARLVEASIKEVDPGILEAAESMGASPFQIIKKVLLPEAKPALINGAAIAITTILGYSAMAGFVGGGGLGDIAIRYGLHRYQTNIMLITVAILVVVVQVMQELGERLSKRFDKRM